MILHFQVIFVTHLLLANLSWVSIFKLSIIYDLNPCLNFWAVIIIYEALGFY